MATIIELVTKAPGCARVEHPHVLTSFGKRWLSRTMFAMLALLTFREAGAQNMQLSNNLQGGPITAGEWKMLPEYCIDTQGFKYGKGQSPNAAKWEALMGPTFWALHHYCLGIVKFDRAQRFGTPAVMRFGYLTGALGDFQFVTSQMPEKYILAPEILTYVGRAHLLRAQSKEAAGARRADVEAADAAFQTAQRIKPDYWPAYSWWASYLADNGKTEEARAVANEGLKHTPQSHTLHLILQNLDSKTKKDTTSPTKH